MIALIQRVTEASVKIDGNRVAAIEHGLLALIGIEKADDETKAKRLLQRIINYRVFTDDDDKMNLNLQQVEGGLLLVPQFTLAADTNSGNRPSFSSAATPAEGKRLFEYLVTQANSSFDKIQTGQFAADMKVSLINDGPVTFWLKV